jgi:hypothetical protein
MKNGMKNAYTAVTRLDLPNVGAAAAVILGMREHTTYDGD